MHLYNELHNPEPITEMIPSCGERDGFCKSGSVTSELVLWSPFSLATLKEMLGRKTGFTIVAMLVGSDAWFCWSVPCTGACSLDGPKSLGKQGRKTVLQSCGSDYRMPTAGVRQTQARCH